MKLYPIDIPKLGVSLLPTMFRSASVVESVRVFLKPLHVVQDVFFSNREKNNYRMAHNGQVCRLRKVLNDAFPARSKSFEIADAEDYGLWLYARDEELRYEQLMVPENDFVNLWSEETMSKFADFVVRIPSNLDTQDNMNVIRALVNSYKLASKKALYEFY